MSHFVRHDGCDCHPEHILLGASSFQSQEENISTFIFTPVHICMNFENSSNYKEPLPRGEMSPLFIVLLIYKFSVVIPLSFLQYMLVFHTPIFVNSVIIHN